MLRTVVSLLKTFSGMDDDDDDDDDGKQEQANRRTEQGCETCRKVANVAVGNGARKEQQEGSGSAYPSSHSGSYVNDQSALIHYKEVGNPKQRHTQRSRTRSMTESHSHVSAKGSGGRRRSRTISSSVEPDMDTISGSYHSSGHHIGHRGEQRPVKHSIPLYQVQKVFHGPRPRSCLGLLQIEHAWQDFSRLCPMDPDDLQPFDIEYDLNLKRPVRIAILDTGVYHEHEAFTGHRVTRMRNFVSPRFEPEATDDLVVDAGGRGTACAALAAGGAFGPAVSVYGGPGEPWFQSGVAPFAKLVVGKVSTSIE